MEAIVDGKDIFLEISKGSEDALLSLRNLTECYIVKFYGKKMTKEELSLLLERVYNRIWEERDMLTEVEFPLPYTIGMGSFYWFRHITEKNGDENVYGHCNQERSEEEKLSIAELRHTIWEAKKNLPRLSRKVFTYCCEYGIKFSVAAKLLKLNTKHVKKLWEYSLSEVAEILTKKTDMEAFSAQFYLMAVFFTDTFLEN